MKKISQIFIVFITLFFMFLNGCQVTEPEEVVAPEEEILSKYRHISLLTHLQLVKVMAATAKYHNFQKALNDGYADIEVVMPNMGHHFLKSEYLDNKFDLTQPEILVYSKNPKNNKMTLVAVEYAVPIELLPDGPPEGFWGDADEWDENLNFGLWTLHAWIWKYNPDGVFAPFNPNVP
jgi:hypothetical protein